MTCHSSLTGGGYGSAGRSTFDPDQLELWARWQLARNCNKRVHGCLHDRLRQIKRFRAG
jgi:hypothetical protein